MNMIGCIAYAMLFFIHSILPRAILFGGYIANNASGAAAFGHINMFINFLWWAILPWSQVAFWYLFPIGGWDWVALSIVAVTEIAIISISAVMKEVSS